MQQIELELVEKSSTSDDKHTGTQKVVREIWTVTLGNLERGFAHEKEKTEPLPFIKPSAYHVYCAEAHKKVKSLICRHGEHATINLSIRQGGMQNGETVVVAVFDGITFRIPCGCIKTLLDNGKIDMIHTYRRDYVA